MRTSLIFGRVVNKKVVKLEPLAYKGYLFKGNRLCIPNNSLRKHLIHEFHCGGLVAHVRRDKTIDMVKESFWWLKMTIEIYKCVL